MKENPRVIVVGGGIGGLATVLALQRFGFPVTVFEQAPELWEVGAGIVITPNAMHALDWLGIGEIVARDAGPAPRYRVCDYRDGQLLELGPPVETMSAQFGAGYHNVHRSDLHVALLNAVRANDPDAIVLGHQFEQLTQDRDGVEVTFASGAMRRGDAVIGADGAASRVRAEVFGDREISYTGQVAFRALVPRDALPRAAIDAGNQLLVGPGRMLLQYMLRQGAVMNLIGIAQEPRWQSEGWSIPATGNEFAELYRDFVPSARELIAAIPAGTLFKWGLRDREPLETWSRGRVVMLGDAAHPTMPFLGQGGCMALEDAVVLARAFAEADSLERAFATYEATRKARANGVQLASREQGRFLQGATEAGSSAGRTAAARGLFSYNPVTVPLDTYAGRVAGRVAATA